MKLQRKAFYFFTLLSLGSTLAVAQEGDGKGPPSGGEGRGGNRLAEFLKRADANGDGKISKEEFSTLQPRGGSEGRAPAGSVDERFARLDGNSDGLVDQTEIAAAAEKMREGMRNRGEGGEGGFRRRPDGDRPEGRRPDGDRPEGRRPDGDRPEGRRPDGDRPEGRRPDGPGPGGPGGAGPALDEVFGRMDKNGDGSVDKQEYTEFSQKEIESRFSRTDGNSDGKLSKDEIREGLERMRNMMRGPQGGPPGGGRGPGGPGPDGPRRGPGGEGEGGGFRRPPNQEGDKPADAPAPKKAEA